MVRSAAVLGNLNFDSLTKISNQPLTMDAKSKADGKE